MTGLGARCDRRGSAGVDASAVTSRGVSVARGVFQAAPVAEALIPEPSRRRRGTEPGSRPPSSSPGSGHAAGGTRTHMSRRTMAFEATASTDSATAADPGHSMRVAALANGSCRRPPAVASPVGFQACCPSSSSPSSSSRCSSCRSCRSGSATRAGESLAGSDTSQAELEREFAAAEAYEDQWREQQHDTRTSVALGPRRRDEHPRSRRRARTVPRPDPCALRADDGARRDHRRPLRRRRLPRPEHVLPAGAGCGSSPRSRASSA